MSKVLKNQEDTKTRSPRSARSSTGSQSSATRKSKALAKVPSKPRAKSDSTAIRSFSAAIAFLNARTNYEKMLRVGYNHTNFNLARMQRILAGVDNPHKKIRTLHVAGTKGKGSTCHMLARMLKSAGFKAGLYTSPHLVDIRERIRVNEALISEAEFTKLIARLAPIVVKLEKEAPTFFEILTAAAFLHFADQKVDFAVIETGLGGRLDSTNVLRPEVCGITSISYDHMQQLGRTLEAIAEEKAGIFKPGVPVICAPQPPNVRRVFKEAAAKVGCELRVVGDDLEFSYRFESSRATGPQTRVCLYTRNSRFDHVHVPLLGEHQAINCGVALGMLDALREKGHKIPEQPAVDGLETLTVPGRLQVLRSSPRTIIDGAHNAASIEALMRAIGQNISSESMVVIFACCADKDIEGMLAQIQLGADKVIFTTAGTPRSASPYDLLLRFQEKSQKMAQVAPDLKSAYAIARNCVGREDLICITGSFYLVGEAMKLSEQGELA